MSGTVSVGRPLRYERVLALGAHTDDIELGCAAFLSRLVRQGAEVAVAAFSRAELSLPDEFPRDTLELEFRNSMKHIGVSDQLYMGTLPVRAFPTHRQEVLDELVKINREFDPDLILTMNSKDTHQDHEVVHNESVRAFRGKTLLGYEIPWNQQQNIINLFVEVSEEDISTKIAMLQEYKSQVALNRPYVNQDFVRSAAVFRGFQARKPLSEAFEVITMSWDL
ncbi:PIG-L deacetylase family protein [Knoellia koreensis]|uniref:PIG-L family deacetylase n=1 Tax=Knoellia koreensis TaxID=2730921 RepID=A0A849HGL5_9MICO|nr:PIG-L deacetylase family protein [Knoellia sp. DB2414S]NNM45783.1 PIG-L family deacetylase [Knoellia sp. DB2414S]